MKIIKKKKSIKFKKQQNFWKGSFGDSYIKRNSSLDQVNELYKKQTAITQEEIFNEFFNPLKRDISIIELGCNIGIKLSILKKMGFVNLTGVEINKNALKEAQYNNPEINFIQSSIESFNPNQEKFDLVFTSGVLIHISPLSINQIIKKIIDLSRNYIFGFEYFSENLVEIKYRENPESLWKQNFPKLFQKQSSDLQLIKEKKINYLNENLVDVAYLFSKK